MDQDLKHIDERYDPISKLSPYEPNQQCKVGISSVSTKMMESKKSNKMIKLQTIEFMDYRRDKIRLMLFDSDIDKFADVVKVGNLVKIKDFNIVPSKDRYVKSGPFEMQFHSKSRLRLTEPKCSQDEKLVQMLFTEAVSGSSRRLVMEIKQMGENTLTNIAKMLEAKKMPQKSDEEFTCTVRATLVSIVAKFASPPWYISCPNEGCMKKLQPLGKKGSTLVCETCDQVFDKGLPRFSTFARISDLSGELIVNLWDDQCSKLVGVSAKDALSLVENDQELEFTRIFTRPQHKDFVFKIHGKITTGQDDEPRIVYQVTGLIGFKNLNETMDYASETKLLKITTTSTSIQ